MAKGATSRSDILEREYTKAILILVRSGIMLIVSLLLVWFFGRLVIVRPLLDIGLLGVAAAIGFGVWGGWKVYRALSVKTVSFQCPYCSHEMRFPNVPENGFDCEDCNRPVAIKDGQVVAIKTITCPVCRTEHKVSVDAHRYICDNCQRPLNVSGDVPTTEITVGGDSEILRNYDVILTSAGRSPNDVALALESIMILTLAEARRLLQELPLTVVRNVPERKADAIRRRLRELGSTAVIQPTVTEAPNQRARGGQ